MYFQVIFSLLFLFPLAFSESSKHSIYIEAQKWHVTDISGFGEILNSITCPHILILSHNTHYSHDRQDSDLGLSVDKTVTIARIYYPAPNTSTLENDFEYAGNFTDLMQRYKIPNGDYIATISYDFGSQVSLNEYQHSKVSCMHAVILASKVVFKYTFQDGITAWYFPIVSSFSILYWHLPSWYNMQITCMKLVPDALAGANPVITLHSLIDFLKDGYMDTAKLGVLQCVLQKYKNMVPQAIKSCEYIIFCLYLKSDPKLLSSNHEQLHKLNIYSWGQPDGQINRICAPRFWVDISKDLRFGNDVLVFDQFKLLKNIYTNHEFLTKQFFYSVQEIIVKATGSNTTILLSQQRSLHESISDQCGLRCHFLVRNTRLDRIKNTVMDANLRQAVVVDSSEYTFVTCYYDEYLDFFYLLQPFQQNLWIAIGICMFILTSLYYAMSYNNKHLKHPGFSSFLYFCQLFLEIGVTLPKYFQKYGFLVAACSFLGLLLTNSYKGIVTQGSIAPTPKSTTLTSFYDLLCNSTSKRKECTKIFYIPKDSCIPNWKLKNVTRTRRFKKTLHGIQDCLNQFRKEILGTYFEMQLNQKLKKFDILEQNFNKNYMKLLKTLKFNRHYWVPGFIPGATYFSAVEKELVQCRNKVALVADIKFVHQETNYLRKTYIRHKFFIGDSPIEKSLVVWSFSKPLGSRLVYKFVLLIQSGIYHLLEKQHQKRKWLSASRLRFTKLNVENETPTVSLRFHSNFLTVFCVAAFMLVLSAITFVGEFATNKWKHCRNGFTTYNSLLTKPFFKFNKCFKVGVA